ncbi:MULTISPECIES: prepilin peptidase [unclassified Acinetobacter]|uniref:prepilin peptidase n=1 Tax=unclassified Acinetobacter TaxID=196816 RepID=UPI0035BAC0BE
MMEIVNLLQSNMVLFYSTIAILSLCVGSFLNVVIHRTPKIMEQEWHCECHELLNPDAEPLQQEKYTLSYPASACPKCGHQIRWYENIPVLSWLFLRGKCADCGNPISIRYPLVEVGTMLCSLLVAYTFGPNLGTVAGLFFTWILIALTAIDFDTQLLPDRLTFPLLGLGLAVNSFGFFTTPVIAIWGALIGFLSLWSVNFIFKMIRGYDGMGGGDFKLLAALGAWVGVMQLPMIILLSALVGSIIGIILKVVNQGKSMPFAFGPYLAIAGWIAFLYGHQISAAYLNMVGLG